MERNLIRINNFSPNLNSITCKNNLEHNPIAVVIPDQHGRFDAKLGRKLTDGQGGFVKDALL